MRSTLFFLFLSTLVYSQGGVTPGVVVPKVRLDTATGQTYAIYLPRDYKETNVYPGVFLFNTTEQTAKVVQKFTIAAELTQSIIIGPNYTLSDTLTIGLKQSERFINTALNNFSIDPSKIILAGIDNGALIASTSAHLSKNIYGVIAVGNVFIDKKVLQLNSKSRFSILSSNEGENFYKLRTFKSAVGLKDIVKGFYIYDGSGWPDAGYLAAALTDLLLTDTTDTSQVEAFYNNDIGFAKSLFSSKLEVEAFTFTNSLKDKYKKRLDLEEQKNLLKAIRSDRSFKFKRVRESTVRTAEELLIQDFRYYLTEDSQNAFFDNLGWWSYQMDDIDRKIDSTSANKEERKGAIRLKNYIVKSVEEKYDLFIVGQASKEQLLFVNILRTLVDPLNQEAHIEVISLSAKEGDYNAALFYLEELMKTGYDDYERLYTIDNTIALRTGVAYNEIVKAYLGKSKYYD